MTLKELIEKIRSIFHTQNQRTLQCPSHRVLFLQQAFHTLEGASRKQQDPRYQPILASIFARLVCVIDAENSGVDRFISAVGMKYGHDCSYCSNSPCQCPEHGDRPSSTLKSADSASSWSLHELQRHLNQVYGNRNRGGGGLERSLLRLFAESVEIGLYTLPLTDALSLPDGYYEEAADALAWLIAIANMLNLDLEEIVIETYKNGCTTCKAMSCTCSIERVAECTITLST